MRETDCKPKADQKNSERGDRGPPLAKSTLALHTVFISILFPVFCLSELCVLKYTFMYCSGFRSVISVYTMQNTPVKL